MEHLYLWVLEIVPLDVGGVYDELPSHLTLMSRFVSGKSPEEIVASTRPLFDRVSPVNLAFGETTQLGPKKVTVHMVTSSAERKLHGMLLDVLNEMDVTFQYPEFIGAHHKAHVTSREATYFKQGSELTSRSVYLVEVVNKQRIVRYRLPLMDS